MRTYGIVRDYVVHLEVLQLGQVEHYAYPRGTTFRHAPRQAAPYPQAAKRHAERLERRKHVLELRPAHEIDAERGQRRRVWCLDQAQKVCCRVEYAEHWR